MIYLLFLIGTGNFPLDGRIEVLEKRSNSLVCEVTFTNPEAGGSLTRFVFSESRPCVNFALVKSDTGSFNSGSAKALTIGDPVLLNGNALYPIIINSVFGDPGRKVTIKKIRMEIGTSNHRVIRLSPSLAMVYKNLILNYAYDKHAKPLGMLIITPNTFSSAVQSLADWKEKKGWQVTVATLSQTGTTNSAIKNYISNAYHTWDPRPEYVLLAGDKDSIPSFQMATQPNLTDHPYTTVDGSDFLSDLLIGRLSASTINELNTIVAKIIGYEKNPYLTDTSWYRRGLMVGANYPYDTMTTPLPTKRWVRQKLFQLSFTQVDTVFDPPITNGQIPVTNAVNQGVTFINYRGGIGGADGWDRPFYKNTDVVGLTNGWKLPVITSIVCNTGNFNMPSCFGETWLRVGSPVTPKGAVGFFGATPPTTHSRWNNCLDYGIYWGLCEDSIYYFGPMTYRGKMEVFMNFPFETSPDSGSEFYFTAYNVLGDPSLELWTGVPRNLTVNHVATVSVGANNFSVQVRDASAQPVRDAMVSLYKRNEVKAIEFTDASGMAYFFMSTTIPDTLFVTATKHNFKPYCGYAQVVNSAVYVGYQNHTIGDTGGNNNGQVNPGETIQLGVTLKNFGTSTTATNVAAKLTDADPLVTITDSLKNYGSINPGGTATAAPFIFNVSTDAVNSHVIKFDLAVTSSQGNWNSSIWIEVKAPKFSYQRYVIVDAGNGILDPGETADLTISVKNNGQLTGGNIMGRLRTKNPGITIVDSVGAFGNVAIGDSAVNSSDRFRVTASSQLTIGHDIDLHALLTGDNGFRDTVFFAVTIGVVTTSAPLGPDQYGYYVYDNTDAGFSETPVYSWSEVDPDLGGPGTILNLANDQIGTVNLPFTFKYYGTNYSKISICSNGYMCMDSSFISDMYNWKIPSSLGPPCLISPFWDDLDPNATDSSGNVCYYNDAGNHRFVVEWSRIQHLHNPTSPTPAELQTFEVFLSDPAFNPTQTGDGEIIFQYKKIKNDDHWHNYATCGIENSPHTDGIQYTFDSLYPPEAAPLIDNRAMKYTTDQPDPFPGVEESGYNRSVMTDLEIIPNPAYSNVIFNFRTDMKSSSAELVIYDIVGRVVKSFSKVHADPQSNRSISWRGQDQTGCFVPAGVYFVELRTNEKSVLKKLVLLK